MAQQRWLSKLIGYDFTIEYKHGKDNSVADALSRNDEFAHMKAILILNLKCLETVKEENKNQVDTQRL